MAVRKNNSRQSDRNTIFKMNAQGYSVLQIEAKLSITPEHIEYILGKYEEDLAMRRADSPELQERARIQAEVEGRRKRTGPANDPAVVELKAQLRAEIMAELTADKPAVAVIPKTPPPDIDLDTYEDAIKEVPEDEVAPRVRKPRRKTGA